VNTSVSRQYLSPFTTLPLESQIEISEVLSSEHMKPFPHSHLETGRQSERQSGPERERERERERELITCCSCECRLLSVGYTA